MSHKSNWNRGYTIAEMVVVLGIFVLIMLSISSSILYFYRSNTYSIEQASAITSGRRGIEYAVKDLRETTYGEDGAYPMISLGQNTVTFYADVDGGGDVEQVRYFLSSGLFKRGVIKATGSPLAYTGTETVTIASDYVRNLEKGVQIFTYQDKNGVNISDLTKNQDVRFISVSLIVNVNPNRLPDEFTLRGSAALRNLRDL